VYKAGEKVMYGASGVCEIESIGPIDSINADKDRLYYALRNLSTGGVAYVPVDSEVFIRHVMKKSDAEKLLQELPTIPPVDFSNVPIRDLQKAFKDNIASHDSRKIIGLIKYIKITEYKKQLCKKKLSLTEDRYLNQALTVVTGELGCALGKEASEIESLIKAALNSEKE